MQWDNFAKEYDEQVGERGDFYHRTYLNPPMLDILGDVKQKKILDLACGQGYFSRILARKEAQVVGIDLSGRLIKIARESEKELDINYFVLNSADLRGIQDQSFDYVIANMALHDISDLGGTISEVGRVVRKGGGFVFSILHPWETGQRF